MGLPGSGKSTALKEIMQKDGNIVRLNKDLMREMLHFDKFTGKHESQTRDAVRELAKMFLKTTNVAIDDTNLNPGTMQSWKDLALEAGAKVEVVDMTHVDVQECVLRDNTRTRGHVGGTVIKNMAIRHGLTTFPKDNVALFDIDGTIADTAHRLHYVQGEKKDWKGFFSEMHLDPVRPEVAKMAIDYYNQGKTVIFFSARPDTYKDVTLQWLKDKGLAFAYTLVMRQGNDKRPDTETKLDMFNRHFPDKSVIHVVVDDRPSIVRLWRDMGLNVIDVGKGIEF